MSQTGVGPRDPRLQLLACCPNCASPRGRGPHDRTEPTCSRCRSPRPSSCLACSCLAASSSRSWVLRRRSSSPVRCPSNAARCVLSCTKRGRQ